MDVCMIDVTDIDCKEGDKAIIFGDDLPVTVLSDILETIPYEILTSVSNRVKKSLLPRLIFYLIHNNTALNEEINHLTSRAVFYS